MCIRDSSFLANMGPDLFVSPCELQNFDFGNVWWECVITVGSTSDSHVSDNWPVIGQWPVQRSSSVNPQWNIKVNQYLVLYYACSHLFADTLYTNILFIWYLLCISWCCYRSLYQSLRIYFVLKLAYSLFSRCVFVLMQQYCLVFRYVYI